MSKLMARLVAASDIYGWPIKVNYRGSEVYKTRVGAFCSILTVFIILFNFLTLFARFIDGGKQVESQQTFYFDRFSSSAFNLSENQFDIEIFSNAKIRPEVGRVRVALETRTLSKIPALEDIELKPCQEERRAHFK